MKKFKKISAWLAMLSLTAAILPAAALGEEVSETTDYVTIEAESGTYNSEVVSLKETPKAFGGKYLQSSVAGQTADIKWTFDVPQTGEYDLWILMTKDGSSGSAGWLSQIQTAFNSDTLAFNNATYGNTSALRRR